MTDNGRRAAQVPRTNIRGTFFERKRGQEGEIFLALEGEMWYIHRDN